MEKIIRKWNLILCMVFLCGCTPLPPQQGPMESISKALETHKPMRSATPSQAVQEALLPSLELASSASATENEPRFDVVVEKIPAREFFIGLVQGTPYNIIVHPSVMGDISLRLTQVTIPEVLEAVRDFYGYEFEQTPYGFKILPFGLQTEVFQINYLNVLRTGESETRVNSGQVSSAGTQSTGVPVSSGSAASATGTAQGSGPGASIKTKSEANFWGELKETLNLIVGDKEGRAVVTSPQSGVVLVRAMPEELRAVRTYLDKTQLSIQRQVIIEAKILEVELKDEYRAGIDWSLVTAETGNKSISFQQGLKSTTRPTSATGNALPLSGSIAQTLGGVFSAAFSLNDFQALIEILEAQGNVQVLSSPQVSTVNNQKAVIRVGNDDFFITNISFDQTGSGSELQQTTDIDLTPFFSGIALDVTPQISEAGYVTLHVHPSVSEVTDKNKTVTLREETVTLPLASSTIRESDSIVRAQSGQIVVIGGLIQNLRRENVTGLPYLSQVPYIGSAFRQTQQTSVKSELVILLRPVLVEDETFDELLNQQQKRFSRMERGFHHGSKVKIFGNKGELE